MGLLSGSLSVTRFNLSPIPDDLDFDREAFREIVPGSEVRESVGFLPIEPEEPYRAGEHRWFFRVRFDKVSPDPTAVQERVKEMVRAELDQGADFVGPKKRRKLKEMAEEELLFEARPRTKIVEAAIDGQVLYVGSTSKNHLGRIAEMLRRLGVVAAPKAPWIDRGDPDIESTVYETFEPGESIAGARFLRALIGDREILVEPESGYVRLQTEDARVTLSGAVLKDLLRYVERNAEILAAKLVTGEPQTSFRLEALPFRLSGLRVETNRHDHWTGLLDERLERLGAVFELLERKYDELAPKLFYV